MKSLNMQDKEMMFVIFFMLIFVAALGLATILQM